MVFVAVGVAQKYKVEKTKKEGLEADLQGVRTELSDTQAQLTQSNEYVSLHWQCALPLIVKQCCTIAAGPVRSCEHNCPR